MQSYLFRKELTVLMTSIVESNEFFENKNTEGFVLMEGSFSSLQYDLENLISTNIKLKKHTHILPYGTSTVILNIKYYIFQKMASPTAWSC